MEYSHVDNRILLVALQADITLDPKTEALLGPQAGTHKALRELSGSGLTLLLGAYKEPECSCWTSIFFKDPF